MSQDAIRCGILMFFRLRVWRTFSSQKKVVELNTQRLSARAFCIYRSTYCDFGSHTASKYGRPPALARCQMSFFSVLPFQMLSCLALKNLAELEKSALSMGLSVGPPVTLIFRSPAKSIGFLFHLPLPLLSVSAHSLPFRFFVWFLWKSSRRILAINYWDRSGGVRRTSIVTANFRTLPPQHVLSSAG